MIGKLLCKCGWHRWNYPSEYIAAKRWSDHLEKLDYRVCKCCLLPQVATAGKADFTEFATYKVMTHTNFEKENQQFKLEHELNLLMSKAKSLPLPKVQRYRSIDDE